MFKLIIFILVIISITDQAFGDYSTCYNDLENEHFIMDGSYNDNFNFGPSFDELTNKGVNIDINYSIYRYGYNGKSEDYVAEYKIMFMFYKMHFIDNVPQLPLTLVDFPNPNEYCTNYVLYSKSNFQIYDDNFKRECLVGLITSGYLSSLSGVENIFFGFFHIDFLGINIPFMENSRENYMEMGYDIYYNFHEPNYGVIYEQPVYPILSDFHRQVATNYKIYLILFYLNVYLYVRGNKRKCASPEEFCLSYPHYARIKFQSTDLDTFYSCLSELNSLIPYDQSPVDYFFYLEIENYLYAHGLDFIENFEKPYYGCTLPKNYYLEYIIHITYYIRTTGARVNRPSTWEQLTVTSTMDFCFNRNFFMSRGFRTPHKHYKDCLIQLNTSFAINKSGIHNIYNGYGPKEELLRNDGVDMTTKIDERNFGCNTCNIGYAKRYKLLLMYYREKIAPHLLDMSHDRAPSPREFCFDNDHYVDSNNKIPYRDEDYINYLTYNQVPSTNP